MEDFVTFEIAKKLKEKGFPIKTELQGKLGLTEIERIEICPAISQVLKWLREEKNLHFEVVSAAYGYNLIISDTPEKGGTDRYCSHINYDGTNYGGAWDRYEDCVLAGIEYTLDDLI